MHRDEKDLQNKMKYSIWETDTDESRLEALKQSPVLDEKSELQSDKEK